MKEDFWILESGDSEEGPWVPWMIPKTLKYMKPTTFEECIMLLETREKRKAESRKILRTQPLRIEPTFIRVRNTWTEEIVPLWALDDDFK